MKKLFLLIGSIIFLTSSLVLADKNLFQGTYLCEEKGSTGFSWINNKWAKQNFILDTWILKRHEDSECSTDRQNLSEEFLYGCFELYRLGETGGWKRFSIIQEPNEFTEGYVEWKVLERFRLGLSGNFILSFTPPNTDQATSRKDSLIISHGKCSKID